MISSTHGMTVPLFECHCYLVNATDSISILLHCNARRTTLLLCSTISAHLWGWSACSKALQWQQAHHLVGNTWKSLSDLSSGWSATCCPAMPGIWQNQMLLVIKKNTAHHTRNSKEQKDLSFPLFKVLGRERKKGGGGKSVLFVQFSLPPFIPYWQCSWGEEWTLGQLNVYTLGAAHC